MPNRDIIYQRTDIFGTCFYNNAINADRFVNLDYWWIDAVENNLLIIACM